MSRAGFITVALMAAIGSFAALVLGYSSLLSRPPSNQVTLHIAEVSPNGDALLVDSQPPPLLTVSVKIPSSSLTPGATVHCFITPLGDLQCGDALLQSGGCILQGAVDSPETKMAQSSTGGLNGIVRSKF